MKHFVFLRKLSEGATWGGGEKNLTDYFRNIDYKKYRITLLVTQDIFSGVFQREGIPVKIMVFNKYTGLVSFARFWKILQRLKTIKPDCVVCVQGGFNDFGLSAFLACFLASKGRLIDWHISSPMKEAFVKTSKRYLGIIPGIGLWWYRQMWRFMARGILPCKIIAVSSDAKRRIMGWYRCPEKKIQVIFQGTDLSKFFPDAMAREEKRRHMGITDNDTLIISVARFSQEKRLERIILGFEELHKEFPMTRLFLIGDGPLKNQLDEQVHGCVSKNRIKFLGFQEDVVSFLRMSDIFVLSSDYEGLSNAMLEAMATGLITVVTKVSGSEDVIEDGKNGFLAECSSPGVLQALRKALELTMEEKNLMRSKAIDSINRKFNVQDGIKSMLRAFELA